MAGGECFCERSDGDQETECRRNKILCSVMRKYKLPEQCVRIDWGFTEDANVPSDKIPGAFNRYGSEGPYGTAVFSSMKKPIVKVSAPVKLSVTHVEVPVDNDEELIEAYCRVRDLVSNKLVVPIPVSTMGAVKMLAEEFKAEPKDCEQHAYGLCVFTTTTNWKESDEVDPDSLLLVSPICLSPKYVEQLAYGRNPCLVETSVLKICLLYTSDAADE